MTTSDEYPAAVAGVDEWGNALPPAPEVFGSFAPLTGPSTADAFNTDTVQDYGDLVAFADGDVVALFPDVPFDPGELPPSPPNPPTPPGSNRTRSAPIVPRYVTPDQTLRRHTEITQQILNSLIRRGDIVYEGENNWSLRGGAQWVEGRPPTATDDSDVGVRQGDLWLDTSGPSVWMAFNTNPGVAVWLPLG